MTSKRKRHINEFLRTSFANSGRVAGMGILYDDYSETSYPSGMMRENYFPDKKVDIPLTEEEKKFRDEGGPVITKRLEDCNDSEVCRALLKEHKRTSRAQNREETQGRE